MKQTDYSKLYQKVCSLFDHSFPLTADCGVLCERRCCMGDENTGMLLFPHEETSLPVRDLNGNRLAVCSGECDRAQRPLSCRIFPFFPVIDERGRITPTPDARGLALCPLIQNSDEVRFDARFLRRVKKAGRLLSRDEECKVFLEEISTQIREEEKLRELFR